MTFIAGSLGNTATLVFFGFASMYQPIFTSALSAGFGVGGAFTTLLSVIQFPRDIPNKPNFGVFPYFLVVVALIACVVVMFLILRNSPFGRSLQVVSHTDYLEVNRRTSEMFDFTPSEKRASFSQILRETWMYYIIMFWVAFITFIVPCVIPFLADNEVMTGLNGVFLVFPPVGAFLAGIYQIPWTSIPAILQVNFFLS